MTDPESTYDLVDREVRAAIAALLDLDLATIAALAPDTPLLSGPLGLRSVDGARLLNRISERFAVDVASEDMALESLENLDTLVTFVAARYDDPGIAQRSADATEGTGTATSGDPDTADPTNLASFAIDLWVRDPQVLTDGARLVAIMRRAAERGHAVVLAECAHAFPNGAVTAVLVLSQSHLSVHTWPELSAANFDLLTCGRLNGERMIASLQEELNPSKMNVTRLIRDVID
jgi:S-adenosylmethionine decarboxylase